ncbi:hypothetical protein BDW74DRAFT_173944 [Aspergillus multicolor]|uniref:uncharacterized protein n=1 Tax=Aspergillus multicolor TaxID=41759 RepID=UPI003CCE12D4
MDYSRDRYHYDYSNQSPLETSYAPGHLQLPQQDKQQSPADRPPSKDDKTDLSNPSAQDEIPLALAATIMSNNPSIPETGVQSTHSHPHPANQTARAAQMPDESEPLSTFLEETDHKSNDSNTSIHPHPNADADGNANITRRGFMPSFEAFQEYRSGR